MDDQDPRLLLARRLRALREDHWLGKRITQPQLAQALGGVSVPLISSWESQTNPKIPPPARLDAYATLFATARSFDEDPGRLISPRDMSEDERRAMNELKRELAQMRSAAMRAGLPATADSPKLDRLAEITESLNAGPYRYPDGDDITIVCPELPERMLARIPYTDINDPDYIELLTYSEQDALLEIHGHLRAANPANQVNLRIAGKLARDDYTSHLISLGGIDWNELTTSALEKLQLPVRQVADWGTEGGQYFEVEEAETMRQHRPVLGKAGERPVLHEDVALFARAVNPFNRKRTITICNGMYGRGTYGAVRALTDQRFRDRNAEYLESRFGEAGSYCMLTRVPVLNGMTITPDWTLDAYRLFEWAG
jgi:transcriptional regulator with XRE-family HTH domain